jgi:hypothetical protein
VVSDHPQGASQRLLRLFAVLAAVGLTGTVVGTVGWQVARTRRVTLGDLSTEDRQRLVESFIQVSGASRVPAWFEPGVGFTLRPNTKIRNWNDTFLSNELGYRCGPAAKRPGVFRVLLVGDSWTFGMGVSEDEAFPKQLEVLANQVSGSKMPIETWSLALPGYNTVNEVTALEVFFDRLQPDAVVLCPTRNDNDSEPYVLPDGSVRKATGYWHDCYGSDHHLEYTYRFVDSYRYLDRWRQAFAAIRRTEHWLQERRVPFLVFFVAFWEEPFVHYCMSRAGIEAPYLIAPKVLATDPVWLGPLPLQHGTPATYRLMARMLYRQLARQLGWSALPPAPGELTAAVFKRAPPGDREPAALGSVRRWCDKVPESFRAGDTKARQCPGPMDCGSGLMGRATTILVRRQADRNQLEVTLRRLEGSASLYPLQVEASVPSAGGATRSVTTVPADGPAEHRLRVPLPASIPPGTVMDVELRASGATLARDVLALRSVLVVSIEQLP